MKKLIYFLVVCLSFGMFSCSTDFDVTAPYKEIPIIYGMLNKDDSVQYIKINKAYLNNEGSAYDAGAVADSNLLPYPLEVKLYGRFSGSTTIDSIQLDTCYLNKTAGNFNANNLYYRTPSGYKLKYILNGRDTVWASYELIVRRQADRKLIARTTAPVVADFQFKGVQNELKLYSKASIKYLSHPLKWAGAVNGKMYTCKLRFKYREVNDQLGTSEEKFLDMPMFTNVKTSNSSGQAELNYNLSGEFFFTYLQNKLDPLEDAAARREYISPIEFYFNVAGEELSRYIEINNSSDGLSDVRPEYTNIENGLGIFSTRMNKVFNDVRKTNLSQDAIFILKEGTITGRDAGSNDLGFR